MAENWINDIDKEDYVAIWIGTSEKSIEEWYEYKLGRVIKYIDYDFFLAHATEDIVPVEELLKGGTVPLKYEQEIIKLAKEKGITQGNRLYESYNSIFVEEKKKKAYNDTIFIGNFYCPQEF